MTRDWLLSTAGYTALTFVLGAFATWATLMLARDKHMSDTAAAVVLGSVTLVAGAAGTFGGGWIADRVAAKRRNGYFLVCAASSLLGVIPAVIALVTHRPLLFLPAIFFAVVLLFINNAPFHAILVGSVPLLSAPPPWHSTSLPSNGRGCYLAIWCRQTFRFAGRRQSESDRRSGKTSRDRSHPGTLNCCVIGRSCRFARVVTVLSMGREKTSELSFAFCGYQGRDELLFLQSAEQKTE